MSMLSKYARKTAVAEYYIRVCVRYKHIRDSVKACNRNQQAWGPYVHGQTEPHFQVPAVVVGAGYMPASDDQPYPSAYWYVGSARCMWSMYEKYGFTQERV